MPLEAPVIKHLDKVADAPYRISSQGYYIIYLFLFVIINKII